MLVNLKDGLEINKYYLESKGSNRDNFIRSLTDHKTHYGSAADGYKRTETQTLFPVEDNLAGDFFHNNYLVYLEKCWSAHFGAVMTPDIIWYTLMCELASIVAADPEKFRAQFSDSKEKQTILVPDGTAPVLPLNLVMEYLRELVPDNLANDFLADFSTSGEREIEARYAVFADLVSPYYSYGMFCCGIPKIDLRGTKEDWQSVQKRWALAYGKGLVDPIYFAKVSNVINGIVDQFDNPNPQFFIDMLKVTPCGSGSQIELAGWITDLWRVQPSRRFSNNFATHVAKVEYFHVQTKQEWQMRQGLLSSYVNGDMLEPLFSRVVMERRK